MGHWPLPVRAARWLIPTLLAGCAGHVCQGPKSEHLDGERFFNPGMTLDKGATDVLYYLLTRDPGEWGRLRARDYPAPPERVEDGGLRVTPIGHATVLLQFDGLNLLTDPVFSNRVGPWPWLGTRRFRPPALTFEQLPPIDAVLITHNHYDHLNLPTITRLAATHNPLFIVPPGDGRLVTKAGAGRVRELDWQQRTALRNGAGVRALPSRHWSSRFPHVAANRSLWSAYAVETAGGPVYFAGDTGHGPHFAKAGRRHGPFRLALLPIGAYAPRWLVGKVHMDPAEAVAAHRELGAAHSIGMHYGTLVLADVGQFQPRDELAAAARAAGLAERAFRPASFGLARRIPPLANGQEN